MNRKEVDFSAIIKQLNDAIMNDEIQEMLVLTDKDTFRLMKEKWRLDELSKKISGCDIPDYDITPLLQYYILKDEDSTDSLKRMKILEKWLDCENNRFFFGINEFMDLCDSADQEMIKIFGGRIRRIAEGYTKATTDILSKILCK